MGDKADSKGTEKTKGRQDRPNKQDQGGEEKKRERDQRDRGNPTREEQQKSKGGSRGRNNDGEPGKQQTGRSGKLDPVFVHSSGTVSEGGKVDRGGVKRGSDKGVYKGGSREDKF